MEWEDYEVDHDAHVDQKIDEAKEGRAGIREPDYGSDAWCERRDRVRIRGASLGNFYHLDAPQVATAWEGERDRVDYVPRAYRAWFGR